MNLCLRYKHENLHNENERVKQIKDKLKEIEKNNSEKFEEIEKQFAKKIEALVNELKQTKKVIVFKDDKITKMEKSLETTAGKCDFLAENLKLMNNKFTE